MVHFFTFKELKLLKKDRKKGNFMGVKIVDTSLRDGQIGRASCRERV